MNESEIKCTLPTRANIECPSRKCHNCGWNADEAERRKRLFESEGLTLCADGLRRLIVHREETMQEKNGVE